jgi:hypothetical protein
LVERGNIVLNTHIPTLASYIIGLIIDKILKNRICIMANKIIPRFWKCDSVVGCSKSNYSNMPSLGENRFR